MPRWYVEFTRSAPGGESRTLATVQRVEFTVEPFVEGSPGLHVTAPVDAVRALGVDVEFGPFGSACVVATTQVSVVVATVVESAIAHGATHVNVDVATVAAGSTP